MSRSGVIAVLITSRRPQTVAAAKCHTAIHRRRSRSAFGAPSGWAYVPVWVGPAPQSAMPVIDAEVIEEPRSDQVVAEDVWAADMLYG